MASIWAQVVAWSSKIGAKLLGFAAIGISFVYIHQSAKRKAAREAVRQERQRIETVTRVKKQQIRKQADEIDQDNADADRDDLRKRMRQQATDRDRG